jgi:hypothetical protein
MKIRECVNGLTELQRIEIIMNYAELVEKGVLVGALLKICEETFVMEYSPNISILLWAEVVIKEVYRFYTLQYFKGLK